MRIEHYLIVGLAVALAYMRVHLAGAGSPAPSPDALAFHEPQTMEEFATLSISTWEAQK